MRCLGSLSHFLLSSIPPRGHIWSADSLLNLDFNFLWSKWNPLGIGTEDLSGKLLCTPESSAYQNELCHQKPHRNLNCCRNLYNFQPFYKELLCCLQHKDFRSICSLHLMSLGMCLSGHESETSSAMQDVLSLPRLDGEICELSK